ncbi:MAG TPA: ribosomal protein S18-alanine N-acetyltransferase [Candidatus Polarisedimenticolaceae bacterium]
MRNWRAEVGAVSGVEDDAMRTSDLDAVLAIERAAFPSPWAREHFLHEIRGNPNAYNPVVRASGRVVAYACTWIVEGTLEINNIAVEPSHRRRGHARALLARAIERAARLGCDRAILEVRPSNEGARRLYASFGFREVGRRPRYYEDNGEDAILMARVLREPDPAERNPRR